jgi:hypothetical protein
VTRPASDIADRVAQRARVVDRFVNKLELLGSRRELTRSDLERAYAGGFLSFFTFYETAWEELFFGLLMGRVTVYPTVNPLVSIKSEVTARRVVYDNRSYADWLPANRTVERASMYLSGGRPFSLLSDVDKGTIKRYFTVRNALAHESRHSLSQFQRSVVGQRVLPKYERRPAGYLRGVHAAGQTRMNLALAELTIIFGRLCKCTP